MKKAVKETKADPAVELYLEVKRDLAELTKIKEDLQKSKERFELAQKAANIATFEWNILANTFRFSPNLKKLYGITDTSFSGNKISDWLVFLHPEDQVALKKELIHAVRKHREIHYEYRIVTPAKHIRWIGIRAKIRYNKLKLPAGVIGVKMDVTEKMEQEQRKDNFIAMASHELKTPITVVKIYESILQKRLKKTKDKEALGILTKMSNNTNRLVDLIKNVLDVTLIKKGKLSIKKEKINIQHFVSQIISDLQLLTPHTIVFKGQTKKYVTGDKNRLQGVFINLITNAIKYSPPTKKIVVFMKEQKKHLVIGVKDYGIGIPQDQQQRVFEQFFQVNHTSKTNTYPGLGIGLYISYQIMQQHQGKIWVKSTEGKGSTFYISLPIGN